MSIEPRTVTVNVLVAKAVEIDEPEWCAGHLPDRAQFRPDLTHNGPKVAAEFGTALGAVRFMRAWITQAPYGELAPEPLPLLAVEIGGDAYSLTPDELRAFADVTRAHLEVLERLADEADRIRGGGQ